MELFTLRLGAPLSWIPAEASPDDKIQGTKRFHTGAAHSASGVDNQKFILPVPTQEGCETVYIWSREHVVTDSDDGPRICLPLPPPLQAGISESSEDTIGHTSRIELPAGSYLFCQGRLTDMTSIVQTLEWFFREVWWTRAECHGPVYLRIIKEDGKTAIQVIMAS